MSATDHWRRETLFILILLAVMFLIYWSLFGQGGYRKLREYRKEFEALTVENSQLRSENEKLIKTVRQLKSDPNAIEKIARERFNFARPGDIIVTLPQK